MFVVHFFLSAGREVTLCHLSGKPFIKAFPEGSASPLDRGLMMETSMHTVQKCVAYAPCITKGRREVEDKIAETKSLTNVDSNTLSKIQGHFDGRASRGLVKVESSSYFLRGGVND